MKDQNLVTTVVVEIADNAGILQAAVVAAGRADAFDIGNLVNLAREGAQIVGCH